MGATDHPAQSQGEAPGVCWITGASSGIGRALALAMAGQGWKVVISSRDGARLESVTAEATGAERVRPYPLDVTDAEAVMEVARQTEHDLGQIDMALFNAGGYRPLPLDEFDVGLFKHLSEVNYLGVANGIAAVLPGMRARRKRGDSGYGECRGLSRLAEVRALQRDQGRAN